MIDGEGDDPVEAGTVMAMVMEPDATGDGRPSASGTRTEPRASKGR